MVGFIYRCFTFGVTVSVHSQTQDTAPTRALLFCFFISHIFSQPHKTQKRKPDLQSARKSGIIGLEAARRFDRLFPLYLVR